MKWILLAAVGVGVYLLVRGSARAVVLDVSRNVDLSSVRDLLPRDSGVRRPVFPQALAPGVVVPPPVQAPTFEKYRGI